MTADVLATIDGALEDWSTSGDAMRWSPETRRVICDGGILWPARRDLPFPSLAGRSITVTFQVDASQAIAALSQVAAAWKAAMERLTTSAGISAEEMRRLGRAIAGRLVPVDRHEYHRRSKARRRRGR